MRTKCWDDLEGAMESVEEEPVSRVVRCVNRQRSLSHDHDRNELMG